MMNVTSSQVENMLPSVSDFQETHGESGNHWIFFPDAEEKPRNTKKHGFIDG